MSESPYVTLRRLELLSVDGVEFHTATSTYNPTTKEFTKLIGLKTLKITCIPDMRPTHHQMLKLYHQYKAEGKTIPESLKWYGERLVCHMGNVNETVPGFPIKLFDSDVKVFRFGWDCYGPGRHWCKEGDPRRGEDGKRESTFKDDWAEYKQYLYSLRYTHLTGDNTATVEVPAELHHHFAPYLAIVMGMSDAVTPVYEDLPGGGRFMVSLDCSSVPDIVIEGAHGITDRQVRYILDYMTKYNTTDLRMKNAVKTNLDQLYNDIDPKDRVLTKTIDAKDENGDIVRKEVHPWYTASEKDLVGFETMYEWFCDNRAAIPIHNFLHYLGLTNMMYQARLALTHELNNWMCMAYKVWLSGELPDTFKIVVRAREARKVQAERGWPIPPGRGTCPDGIPYLEEYYIECDLYKYMVKYGYYAMRRAIAMSYYWKQVDAGNPDVPVEGYEESLADYNPPFSWNVRPLPATKGSQ